MGSSLVKWLRLDDKFGIEFVSSIDEQIVLAHNSSYFVPKVVGWMFVIVFVSSAIGSVGNEIELISEKKLMEFVRNATF